MRIAAAVLVALLASLAVADAVPSHPTGSGRETTVRIAPIPASAWTGLVLLGGIVVAGVMRRRSK